ncbi:transcription factor ATF2 [Metarhizium album ARSEF 1941]|uniref:Transcription factor ATF2 n=1 Tax=Metarhizium album (strain ARSEF 1941) TaxID=1081103 RepID=A0A0B2WD14_METAS|nr:transcription factor ATF2 [Metarhizium album ARSEF 1941]KHN93716.1 transcription factor ATF2 [Metarhizium album ARSEF 1941]
MSTADFWIGRLAGENEFDLGLFHPAQNFLSRNPQTGVHDDGTADALFGPLPGLLEEDKPYSLLFSHQLEKPEASLFSSDANCLYPAAGLNPVSPTSAPSTDIVNQTTPPSLFGEEDDASAEAEKPGSKRKRDAKTATKSGKPKASSEKPPEAVPKRRRQPKRGASKKTTNSAAQAREANKPKYRRQRSLEKNRVAASKCRKRKKQWTETLEQKKSGLESVHRELQSEYTELLQESSKLKNFLITHASCQDPNIDTWIKNEASKYVRNLHNSAGPRSMYSVSSVEAVGSADDSQDDAVISPQSPVPS